MLTWVVSTGPDESLQAARINGVNASVNEMWVPRIRRISPAEVFRPSARDSSGRNNVWRAQMITAAQNPFLRRLVRRAFTLSQ
jgi:hypothetical protein